MDERDATATLMRLVNGYQVTQAIHVAAVLGVPDLLAHGPRESDELAEECDADPGSLYRLLRALASVGVLEEQEDRRFTLTPVGERLRSDVSGSLDGWARFVGRPSIWNAWAALEHSIRTGENAFAHVHGTDVWSWRAARPDESEIFDGAMQARTGATNRALLEAYDFSRFGVVVDVGGGNGTLLAAVLAEHPGLRGILFDQSHVTALAPTVLEDAGVADRCEVRSGDFFAAVPEGGDAYVLKSIIHDWEDKEALAILRNVRVATPGGGRLLLLERELGAPNADPATKFTDLLMLVGPGGRERSRDEYERLLANAGFRLVEVTPTSAELIVFEGVPV